MSFARRRPRHTTLDNNAKNKDILYTKRALELAAEGIGRVSPNPLVGCVIVSADGSVVGEGSYSFDGVTHAEAIALAEAGPQAKGGTAYVSLEPHSHHGRTPPCTDALINAGIARVVAPIEDPNPLVSGRGFETLRKAGIEVVTGVLSGEASQLNEKFIVWHKKKRPFVHLKLAISLDGRISLGKSVSTVLSDELALERVHQLRHEYDAILIGGNTAFVDDPNLTDRSRLPRRRPLVRIVLDNRLRLSPSSRLASTAREVPTMVFTTARPTNEVAPLADKGVEVVQLENSSRDLGAVLRVLAEREIQSVLVEGGTEIAGAFCDARWVDKFTFIAAPLIIGGEAPVAVGGHGATDLSNVLRLKDLAVARLGDDIEFTGYPTVP
jgi:diaminohydroxyphosphoribosylaminopyrimidine deaminase/5-amino-6-(5-phosphoribosylamino)uracil reductase